MQKKAREQSQTDGTIKKQLAKGQINPKISVVTQKAKTHTNLKTRTVRLIKKATPICIVFKKLTVNTNTQVTSK